LFGRVHDLSEAALAQYFAIAENRKAAQISLVASVANAYLNLLADDALLRVTRQTLETREESTRLTKLRFDNGASSELDFRQAESLLEGARVALAQSLRQRSFDENALQLLVGQTLPADLPPSLPLGQQQIPGDLPAGVPSDLLVRRPDVRASEQQLLAANANIGAARAAFFPRISLTANLGSASTELSGLFKSGSFAFTGTAQLLQPIFDAGRNRANLDVARVNRDIAVAQYERSIQSAFREVADALAGRATLGEQLRAQAAQTNALAITYRLADLRYRAGAASYLDSLDAQRQLFIAQQALVQTQALQLQNLVTLYRVLGGGWRESAELAAGTTPAVPPPR
ncbi:MAG: efflux transporter outer membrane subunit, partial [Caldimonas sp.]